MARPLRVLVTGVNGFVGRHVAQDLRTAGHVPIGVGTGTPDPELGSVLADFVPADLTTGWPQTPDVDAVVHLAALSAVGPSFADPQLYLHTNSAMVTHLGEHLLESGRNPRVLLVSSGAVYAARPHPITEGDDLAFSSPYGVSKVLTEHQAAYYRGRGLDWLVARPFNHIGPGQRTGFLLPDLYEQVVASLASAEPMVVGDLRTERDYTDVRDVVRAYRLLLESDQLTTRTFNVCSGHSVSGESMLAELLTALGVEDLARTVDQSRLRPGDASKIVGNSDLLRQVVGWEPHYRLADTVRDFVTHERAASSA